LMPLEFDGGGVLAEHTAVRERVGLFDVSHMGTFVVTGPGANDGLNEVFTNDLNRIGQVRRSTTSCVMTSRASSMTYSSTWFPMSESLWCRMLRTHRS
jgi:glycine cleavage system aminomethyltransferase T